jgi:hypothetical protein
MINNSNIINRSFKKSKPKQNTKTNQTNRKTTSSNTTLTDEYRNQVSSASYLGKKGYTIPKSVLTQDDQEFLKIDLFMKPQVNGPQYGPDNDCDAFPVYRENAKKMYLPRFYGIQRYGLPPKSEIESGEDISVEFVKPLRDYQENIIGIYMKHVRNPICSAVDSTASVGVVKGNGAILEVPCGQGKTVMALKIISLVAKKTLIIVHKEFLLNQWIERAAEFLPAAKIGKIQGPILDIEGKDIVIGMLQTLYDREFPEGVFDSFGLTIVDEVHRIGSEQFSKTLLRVATANMLGISATVDRKDKLTKILYMFIGPKIYSEQRKQGDPVCVRGIEYVSTDPEFNTTDYDFRGNPKYSTMISKLSDFGPRSDFIVRVIGDLVQENEETGEGRGQIMVLCHNRSLLTYLHDAIVHRNIGSVGFYVGGMKQRDLQETESKKIVLATYAMAAEALDIKTLSILVMASPKTDITQSVGRILRVKHDRPIVVDIVDRHEIFQNQWKQRKTFYRKCNYRIRSIDSIRYGGMSIDWDADRSWTRVFDPKTFGPGGGLGECSSDGDKLESTGCLISIDKLDLEDT